ncbi:MAG: GNAT family N-acetyltransferase [Limisphaerales bacterium]|jgi:GNAT superfamily N-acetyltransferase
MSLDYALEGYPCKTQLRDGTECVIRPLRKGDCSRLMKFFDAVPEMERLFIKHRLSDPGLLKDWCQKIDFESNLPLLLLKGTKVIGEATLHQRQGGWKRHVGLVTFLTHPEYRGRDISKILVGEMVKIGRHLGLKKLEAELNGERTVAIKSLQQLGFRDLLNLPDYLLDMQGGSHDYVVMGLDIVTDEEYASAF